jgi:hypothetical protein
MHGTHELTRTLVLRHERAAAVVQLRRVTVHHHSSRQHRAARQSAGQRVEKCALAAARGPLTTVGCVGEIGGVSVPGNRSSRESRDIRWASEWLIAIASHHHGAERLRRHEADCVLQDVARRALGILRARTASGAGCRLRRRQATKAAARADGTEREAPSSAARKMRGKERRNRQICALRPPNVPLRSRLAPPSSAPRGGVAARQWAWF